MSACFCSAQDMLSGHSQLLIVTTADWNEVQGQLQMFERTNEGSTWTHHGDPFPVVVGQNGLAWGIGLHPKTIEKPVKAEGDRKAPAGIFTLGRAFGFASSSEMSHLRMEYFQLDENTEAVDDPRSQYYNLIVKRNEVSPDWGSSEKMREIPLYALGAEINHNYPNPQPGAGSAIFFHIWRSNESGTWGCTAMDLSNLTTLISWLDSSQKPLLVQLPLQEYQSLQSAWSLPPF